MADCIDLLEEFGDKYRIAKDKSYFAEYGPTAWTHDPWYLQIPCRLGHIYPHGGSMLAVSLDAHPIQAKQLAALDCCRIHQQGDDGTTWLISRLWLRSSGRTGGSSFPTHGRPNWPKDAER